MRKTEIELVVKKIFGVFKSDKISLDIDGHFPGTFYIYVAPCQHQQPDIVQIGSVPSFSLFPFSAPPLLSPHNFIFSLEVEPSLQTFLVFLC